MVNSLRACVELACLYVRRYYQRIVSGKQDVVYDGDGSPGFLYHSHSMEMMQMMQKHSMEQASPSSARISSDASAASPSFKIRNSV